mgnify:CR=1 FL=1
MIDFLNIEKYKENNRIEAKKALGGLPKSIWETYSAFANALGGVLLLGVEEYKDKSLHPVNLPDPEKMIKEFWSIINNPLKVNTNILSEKDVYTLEVNGNHIIVINVPRAQRVDKPIYIDNNPLTGTYRRNGEGDYRCSVDEVLAMQRDAQIKTQDMTVLKNMTLDVLDMDCVRRYRYRMKKLRPGHRWEKLSDIDFLEKVGAVSKTSEQIYPTAAGLLMFGYEYEIVKEFPDFFLDYQERMEDEEEITYRIVSSYGDWSGNICDFYFRVCDRIMEGIQVPDIDRTGEEKKEKVKESMYASLREAVANSIINADYYGSSGIEIIKTSEYITITNPGSFRIDVKEAIAGGKSDPRNAAIIKMFTMVNVSENMGSGIPNIFRVWKKQGLMEPVIKEYFEPEQIEMTLPFRRETAKLPHIWRKSSKSRRQMCSPIEEVIEYLTENISATGSELAAFLGMNSLQTKNILTKMIEKDILEAEGNSKNKTYKMKA